MEQRKATTLGQQIFGFSIFCFGMHDLVFACGLTTVAPGPPWEPQHTFITFAVGIVLAICGLALTMNWKRSIAAALLAFVLFLQAAIVFMPGLLTHIRHPGNWTAAFELFALCGATIALAATLPEERAPSMADPHITMRIETVGRLLFALSILVFAIQHFLYARFIAGLIPAWCPFRLFFAWFVGVAFATTTLSIVVRRVDHLALQLLGAMFLLWVVILHIPRTFTTLRNGDEWTSMLVALAFCGASWALLPTCRRKSHGLTI